MRNLVISGIVVCLLFVIGCKKKENNERNTISSRSRVDLLTGGNIRKWKQIIPKPLRPCDEDDLYIFSKQEKTVVLDFGTSHCGQDSNFTFTWELSHNDSVLTEFLPGGLQNDIYIISLSETKLVISFSLQDSTKNTTYIAN